MNNNTNPEKIGVYIHIPFCGGKCPYCDFYSVGYNKSLAEKYVASLKKAIACHPFGSLAADTLYFGGGTPTILPPEILVELYRASATAFGLEDGEITIEANPCSITPNTLKTLRQGGFNRISFGVQSLNDNELFALGRKHDSKTAVDTILMAKDAGFENISIDLMLGIPFQSVASLDRTITQVSTLPINHISAYILKIEPATPFFEQKESTDIPDEELSAQLYLQCVEKLAGIGFAQYEISNFAKDNAVSRHNLKYWNGEQYLGIGTAAHSFLGGKRFYFPGDIESFIASNPPFTSVIQDGCGGDFEEYAMLRLRLCDGLDLEKSAEAFGIDPLPIIKKAWLIIKSDPSLLTVDKHTIKLTAKGFLLSNSIIANLLL